MDNKQITTVTDSTPEKLRKLANSVKGLAELYKTHNDTERFNQLMEFADEFSCFADKLEITENDEVAR